MAGGFSADSGSSRNCPPHPVHLGEEPDGKRGLPREMRQKLAIAESSMNGRGVRRVRESVSFETDEPPSTRTRTRGPPPPRS